MERTQKGDGDRSAHIEAARRLRIAADWLTMAHVYPELADDAAQEAAAVAAELDPSRDLAARMMAERVRAARVVRGLLRRMRKGRPADPREVERWDKAIATAERWMEGRRA